VNKFVKWYFLQGKEMLTSIQILELQYCPLPALTDYLFNMFTYLEAFSSISKLRMRQEVVTSDSPNTNTICTNKDIRLTALELVLFWLFQSGYTHFSQLSIVHRHMLALASSCRTNWNSPDSIHYPLNT
jgi:hypothetical protein